ncbi:hypothetical protein B0T19DRAFT_415750 [Cercophora scortea]|uniref:Uncharacterized protein n=1 Tax=Cercophora scortea TaxID=314031 RepID=A0AAE0IWB1_9PEZI|nr:hypothetical protein B0T19DRAFT_415750 [Cercophora scortea]
MSSRASLKSLRAGKNALETLSLPVGLTQRRCLSSTAPQASSVINFRTNKNPELKEVLSTIREKIILPAYLPADQQAKIYNANYKQKLLDDPITMEVDGEEVRFGYVDRYKLPNTKKAVVSALNAMKTPTDFLNLPTLLEGLRLAHRKVSYDLHEKMIRRACVNGCIAVILECVKQVKRTGFTLETSQAINELLVWIQKEALDSDWDKKETERALRRTQSVLEMLEADPLHQPAKDPKLKALRRFPFYRDPQILAARLHMAAALAVKHQAGHDADGKVAKYAQELVRLWPKEAGLLELHPEEAYARQHDTEMRYLLNRNAFLWFASPVLNGLRLAAQVVEPALAKELLERAANVEKQVQSALAQQAATEGGAAGGRGLNLYNELCGPQASAAV